MNRNLLSCKDLSYVCDMFNWNLNIYNACKELEKTINDNDLKDVISNIKLMHKESCEELTEVINNG